MVWVCGEKEVECCLTMYSTVRMFVEWRIGHDSVLRCGEGV